MCVLCAGESHLERDVSYKWLCYCFLAALSSLEASFCSTVFPVYNPFTSLKSWSQGYTYYDVALRPNMHWWNSHGKYLPLFFPHLIEARDLAYANHTPNTETQHRTQRAKPWPVEHRAGLSLPDCDFPSVSPHSQDPCISARCFTELTYDLHTGQVDSDFLESGEASSCVILPAMAVISPAPIIGTFCWVVQPKQQR